MKPSNPSPVRKTQTGQIMCYENGQIYLLPTVQFGNQSGFSLVEWSWSQMRSWFR